MKQYRLFMLLASVFRFEFLFARRILRKYFAGKGLVFITQRYFQ